MGRREGRQGRWMKQKRWRHEKADGRWSEGIQMRGERGRVGTRMMRGRDEGRRNEQESKLRGQRGEKKRLGKKESVEQPNQRLASASVTQILCLSLDSSLS